MDAGGVRDDRDRVGDMTVPAVTHGPEQIPAALPAYQTAGVRPAAIPCRQNLAGAMQAERSDRGRADHRVVGIAEAVAGEPSPERRQQPGGGRAADQVVAAVDPVDLRDLDLGGDRRHLQRRLDPPPQHVVADRQADRAAAAPVPGLAARADVLVDAVALDQEIRIAPLAEGGSRGAQPLVVTRVALVDRPGAALAPAEQVVGDGDADAVDLPCGRVLAPADGAVGHPETPKMLDDTARGQRLTVPSIGAASTQCQADVAPAPQVLADRVADVPVPARLRLR